MISVLGAIANAIIGSKDLPTHTCLFYRKEGYSVGAVKLDLILNENHSQDAEVTENPLQDGRAVSDGIFVALRDGSLTGLVTNHSIKLAEEAAKNLSEQTANALLDKAENFVLENRARKVWEELLAVQKRGELVTIVTSLEVYDNVAITHLDTERDGETGEALAIQINFKQVQKVQLREDKVTAQVQPKDMNSDINRSAAVGVNGGQQVGAQPTEAQKRELVQGVQ